MAESPSVAVVMPAYNEEALDEFLVEVEASLLPVVRSLEFHVVDDCSSTPLPLERLVRLPLGTSVHVLRNQTNLGHGPSAVRAYRQALPTRPDVVIHVDGDGQFVGEDFPRLLAALGERDGVVGRRVGRREPWFRRALTLGSRLVVNAEVTGPDVNSPLRAYREPVLRRLLAEIPDHAVVPHLHFAVLHRRLELDVADLDVTHRPRRGESTVGTTWQGGLMAARLPSRRLLTLAWRAWLELRDQQRPVAPTPLVLDVLEDAA